MIYIIYTRLKKVIIKTGLICMNNEFTFDGLKKDIVNLKWFFFIYFLFLIVFICDNNLGFKTVIAELIFFLILGCILLLIISHRNLPIHKVALLIIIVFGISCLFLSPIIGAPDENEHICRGELTSRGEFIPQYVYSPGNNYTHKDYKSIRSISQIGPKVQMNYTSILSRKTVFQTNWDDQKIDYTPSYVNSVFAQNPFYGYIPQAIGIDIAKGLNLNNIWMIWLGRLCNLLVYGMLASYAIKKAPIYKSALFVTSTLPLSIFQASSMSIDAMVNGLSLLTIAYFLYMYKQEDNTLTLKHVGIFTVLSVLTGLVKITFLALALLIFLVPKSKFKDKKTQLEGSIGFIITTAIILIWTKFYASIANLQSWRFKYGLTHHVNAQSQISFIIHNFSTYLSAITSIKMYKYIVWTLFYSGGYKYFAKTFILLYLVLFIVFCIEYPQKEKIKNRSKVGLCIIGAIILFGTITIEYITWSPVGSHKVVGMQARYLIPLIAFAPMVLNINRNNESPKNNIKLLLYTITIGFIALTVFAIFLRYYF